MGDITTIQITAETWRQLNAQKEPGDTFDDVIRRLLSDGTAEEETPREEPREARQREQTHAHTRTETDGRIEQIVATVSESWDDAPEKLEARREAARAALRLAEARGTLSRGEAVDELLPEFAVVGQSDETWWRKNIRPALQAAGEHVTGRGYSVER